MKEGKIQKNLAEEEIEEGVEDTLDWIYTREGESRKQQIEWTGYEQIC